VTSLTRLLIALYPPWWRRRYAEENIDLAEQVLADPGTKRGRLFLSLLFGAALAWVQVRRLSDYLQPVNDPASWGVIPRGAHRDIFGNRGLWPRSEAQLEPGEELLGVLDGATGRWWIARLPFFAVFAVIVQATLAWIFIDPRQSVVDLLLGAIILPISLVVARRTHSRYVSVAVTSYGIVVFRRHLLSGRTGRMIQRMPAVDPKLITWRNSWRRVRLGEDEVWLIKKADPLLAWMSRSYRSSMGRT
jgi:hypothetical protein